MLTQLREIVEKVAASTSLQAALELLVDEICLAMETEVCSIYLADNERQCYYLMATRGLKKPRGRILSLAFNEGVVGLVGQLAEPLNLADVQTHPNFKLLPHTHEEQFKSFLGVPIIYRRQRFGVLVVQQREYRQFDEGEESFLVTLATQMAGLLAQVHLHGLFRQYRQTRLIALAASPGVAIGEGWVDSEQPSLEAVAQACVLNSREEQDRLTLALEEAMLECRRFSKRFAASGQNESAAVFDFYAHLLNDPQLRSNLFNEVERGFVAEWAVKITIERFEQQFIALSDPYLRERASDLRTLGQRLLFHLDDNIHGPSSWPERFILVADELTATQLAELPAERLVGVVVRDGATNSHAAIIVRALGIPLVMGADIQPLLLHQRLLIVDGYSGELLVDPEPIVVREYQRRVNQDQHLTRLAENLLDQPAMLSSGERITIYLNAGLSLEHEQLLSDQVDGVGLYRTELPFMLQAGFPSEEEQLLHYREMLSLFPQRPVTLRTLDIGADKQLPYMPLNEENPSLGWRGIRITLDQPDLFMAQMRAMLRANAGNGNLHILLPMITSIEEIDSARELLERAWDEVAELLQCPMVRPPLGIMLEVPSMLFLIDHLPGKIDFISVGTNDLIQYLLAVDRNNTRVASLYDGMHPAVLRSLQQIIQLAEQAGLPVSLCGEMAGDPMSVLLLIGMGYRTLSMNSRNVARIKYLLRHLSLQELEILTSQILQEPFAAAIRARVTDFMDRRGLGGLIRAGMSTLAI